MEKQSEGFSLIELLIVIAIIGILVAIATPFFVEYRKRAFDDRAATDVRTVATAEESNFATLESYTACDTSTCGNLAGVGQLSNGVEIEVVLGFSPDPFFTVTGSHPSGTGRTFVWNSADGGMQD